MPPKIPQGNKHKDGASIEDEFEQRFDDLVQPVAPSDRPTPVMPEPPKGSLPKNSQPPPSQKPTQPAPEVDIHKLFSLSSPSSAPSPLSQRNVVFQEVADVMAGIHPSLKPSPVPREYPLDQTQLPPGVVSSVPPAAPLLSDDKGPEIEVNGNEFIDLDTFGEPSEHPQEESGPLEKSKKILQQCLPLYREMDIDFSSIHKAAEAFRWKNKDLTEEQITDIFLQFLKEITNLLARHILVKQTEVIQTKMGKLAGQLLLRIGRIDHGSVVCDEGTLGRFRIIKQLVDAVPVSCESSEIAESFIRKVQLVQIFVKG